MQPTNATSLLQRCMTFFGIVHDKLVITLQDVLQQVLLIVGDVPKGGNSGRPDISESETELLTVVAN